MWSVPSCRLRLPEMSNFYGHPGRAGGFPFWLKGQSMSIRTEDMADMDFSDVADVAAGKLAPIHPGKILREDFLLPLGITQYRLAKEIGVSQRRIGEIVQGTRGITVDTALRLAAFFGTDAQSWINLQTRYDTELARESMRDALSRIHRFELAAA
jgi:addiction module HigA family antidote